MSLQACSCIPYRDTETVFHPHFHTQRGKITKVLHYIAQVCQCFLSPGVINSFYSSIEINCNALLDHWGQCCIVQTFITNLKIYLDHSCMWQAATSGAETLISNYLKRLCMMMGMDALSDSWLLGLCTARMMSQRRRPCFIQSHCI